MAKLMLMPSSKVLDYDVDAFLLGIEKLSVNMQVYFSLDEIMNLKTDKEIFINLNKNMHKDDLEQLEVVLRKLEKLNIKGVFFYDLSVLNLVRKFNLKLDLVFAQEHALTNYETINYWYNEGVSYAQISSEICMNEIKEIINNTKSKLIVPLLGYFPMFVSRRHLIQNYLDFFKLNDKSNINYIEKEGKTYPIIDEGVTTVYTNAYMNGIKEYQELKDVIDYALINSFLIGDEKISKIINLFKTVSFECIDEYNKEISNILDSNTDTFFLHKETIYKVK